MKFRRSAALAALSETVDSFSRTRVSLTSCQRLKEFWIFRGQPANFLCEFPVLLCLLQQFRLEFVQFCLPLLERRNPVRRKEQDA